jgi:hypothetical protein
MSSDIERTVKALRNWYLAGGVAGGIVGLILFTFVFLGRSPAGKVQTAPAGGPPESSLETARHLLLKESDFGACQAVLNHINTHFSQFPESRPPAMDKGQMDALRQQVGLEAGEVEEIAAGNCTRLDAHYLEHCCLLRDAARWLDDRGPAGKAGPPGLEQAAAAFDWVVRQVRTRGPGIPWVAPVLVLRRGWGTDLDRALIFLALLDQIGSPDGRHEHLHGCLLFLPDPPNQARFWACGVQVGEGRDLYLFDPRLGMALPGPQGKGIATLAQARTDPAVLGQLDADKDRRYDVTPEQARTAEVCLVCPLSGLSPRMKHLQDKLFPPLVEIHLAQDVPGDLARLKAAAGAGADREPVVRVWPEGTGLLRRFLSPESFSPADDNTPVSLTRQQRFLFELVPWKHFPGLFQDPQKFPYNAGLGQRVREGFLRPFVRGNIEGGHSMPTPRDLLLRGRPGKAAPELVSEREHWLRQRNRRAAAGNVEQQIGPWLQQAFAAYANQVRARNPQDQEEAARAIAELWNHAEPVEILLQGAIAVPRLAEITYQLGLCKQEQAERLQARLDLAAGKGEAAADPADVEKARAIWRDALGWWKEFAEQYSGEDAYPASRRLRGRAQAVLGDRQGAVASWKDLSGDMTDLEKLASLYRARRLVQQQAH